MILPTLSILVNLCPAVEMGESLALADLSVSNLFSFLQHVVLITGGKSVI